jgi:hypothetical protein
LCCFFFLESFYLQLGPCTTIAAFTHTHSLSLSLSHTHTHTYSIIKSLGLSVSDFNTITRRLAHDGKLRSKVLKQAYLYRLESRVNERYVGLF